MESLKSTCIFVIASNPGAYNLSTLPVELLSYIETILLNYRICDVLYQFVEKLHFVAADVLSSLAHSPSHYKKVGALLKKRNFAVFILCDLESRLFMK